MTKPSAIIIGAGIGGIATAARLAKNGYEVKVFEKNAQPGGRCGQIVREGHRFDVGPTLFLMPEVWDETFAALGFDREERLPLTRIDPTYRVHFRDGTRIQLTSNIGEMQTQLERIESSGFTGFLAYLAEGAKHYKLSLEKFVGRNFYSLFDYFSLSNLPLIFKLRALQKHYTNIGRYFKDERLKAVFTFQNMYLGLSPYQAPATYSLLQYTELAEGVWYPKENGMYGGILALTKAAEELGVLFYYDTPIKKILTNGNLVSGVVTEDGKEYSADLVVGNADLPYIYSNLLPKNSMADKLDKKKYTCSTIMFYWAVDKRYDQIPFHNIFLGKDYKASFDEIFEQHDLPADPSFYIHAPGRLDPSVSPAGEDSLYVLVPVGHLDPSNQDEWQKLTDRAREAVFERIGTELGITDLREHIKFEIIHTPLSWKRAFNLAKGAAFGLSHDFWQVGYLRPRNRHDRFKNLYFAGASTHPGTGLPIVLLSAKLAVERILKERSTL